MKTLLALLVMSALQDPIPQDAQQIVTKADAKIDALRKAFEEACTRVKAQEMKDLQRVHDAIRKGDPGAAAAVKARIDVLAADVNVAGKGAPAVVQWLQGKWILAGVADKNFGEVWEFKGEKVFGTGVGDRVSGKILLDGGKAQVVWDSGLVEFLRVPEVFGDETTGVCRTGEFKAKRLKQ